MKHVDQLGRLADGAWEQVQKQISEEIRSGLWSAIDRRHDPWVWGVEFYESMGIMIQEELTEQQ